MIFIIFISGKIYAIQRLSFDELIKATNTIDGILLNNERLTLKFEATRVHIFII